MSTVLFLVLWLSSPAAAQLQQGTIVGQVVGPTGAAVGGGQVTLVDRLGNALVSVDLGVRGDRSRMLVAVSQWSPRLGVAYHIPNTDTRLRASLDRFFQPAQAENLLLGSSEPCTSVPVGRSGGLLRSEIRGIPLTSDRIRQASNAAYRPQTVAEAV